MKPLFRDDFGEAVGLPVNAICYEATDGGDLVRGKPHTWDLLKSYVWNEVQKYRDLTHLKRGEVERRVQFWLEQNEVKDQVRDHECSCGHKWTATIVLSRWTRNLSGEESARCPVCHGANGAFTVSSPARKEKRSANNTD